MIKKLLSNNLVKYLSLSLLVILLFIWIIFIFIRYYYTPKVYSFGDGLGVNQTLVIYFDSFYEFTWSGCIGNYDYSYGYITYESENYILHSLHQKNGGQEKFPKIFYKIKWGKREYLIEKENIIDFCNAINVGSEPNRKLASSYFLNEITKDFMPTNMPEFPKQYKAYILKKSVLGTIIEEVSPFLIKINIGSESGLKEEMILWGKNPMNRLIVQATEMNHSIVEVDTTFSRKYEINQIVSSKIMD